ncbi:hypothetical protein AKJ65_00170 [candidate division MSBL1 archaeon SCGC-AAA259E19]|uniref:DUF7343 domain-containing protein n=1 Tax=candidate division MSBL1 archaeon SCGC-AAA259E19 TaxID=1698264 RepID=A0A133UP40_9EURY|nr:hypothetical protein AKJ65_00170 [candidate division MSBL1 archaeon SCGC-AAA259E19]
MKFRDLFHFVVLIVVLQSGLGLILFGLTGGVPGVTMEAIGLSIVILIIVSSIIGLILYWLVHRYMKERAIKTAMMAMSDDEQEVLRKVMQLKEVRQDELRRKLDFSKSKLSALINNLKDKNAIKKTRYKRTNKIKPTEEFQR